MSIVLASAARLEGYLESFSQVHPWLIAHYDHIHLACSPQTDPALAGAFRALPKVDVTIARPEQTSWRHLTLSKSLEYPCTHIHYADYDHIIGWFKDFPQEVEQVIGEVQQTDCLIVGRTPQALSGYARALIETEAIVNLVFSELLGQRVDLCAGVRGLSRRAAEFLMRHSPENHHPIGSDAEWPVLLHRGGFQLKTTWMDGLSWVHHLVGGETPDQARANYDARLESWETRIRTTREILEAGFAALEPKPPMLYFVERSTDGH